MTARGESRIRLYTIIALVVVPVLLALGVAEVRLAIRERRPAHWLNGHVVTPFPPRMEAAVLSLRSQFSTAYPMVAPQQFLFRQYRYSPAPDALIPLGGISRTKTDLCDAGNDIFYDSDSHGFNNPDVVWSTTPDVALIGDSFVQGVCVPDQDQLGTLIRTSIPATLNLGVLGAGPISELATLREYAAPLKPKVVLWFFFEGNDIEDLERERTSVLAQYLDPDFSQDLWDKQPAIDSVLSRFADSVLTGERTASPDYRDIPGMITLPRVRMAIRLGLPGARKRIDPSLFTALDSVFVLAQSAVEAWGGKLYLVYLPDYHRFDKSPLPYTGYEHFNSEVEVHNAAFGGAERAGIPVIDIAKAFAADPHPTKYWPHPLAHYGANGYALIAQTVLAYLADSLAR
jgi:hypothetical protein